MTHGSRPDAKDPRGVPGELHEAVEAAYRVFARYTPRGGIAVCRCESCVAADVEKALNTTPLREIPAPLLAEYTNSAHPWSREVEDDLRYLLPRYLELISADEAPTNADFETCLERLAEAGYRDNWPHAESAAVNAFFLAWMRARLADSAGIETEGQLVPSCDAIEEVLCTAAHAGAAMGPLLDAWDADKGAAASLHLARVIASADWRKQKLCGPWGSSRGRGDTLAAMHAVIAWLRRPETSQRLEEAFFSDSSDSSDGDRYLLSQAESIVRGAARTSAASATRHGKAQR